MRTLRLLTLIVVALLGCPPVAALAGGTAWEGIGGWEGDSQSEGYGFAALGALIPRSQVLVIPVRLSVSYLYYQFDSSGTSFSVRSPGVSLMSGIRLSKPHATTDLMAGIEVRRDHRVEDLAGSPATDETRPGVELMADADIDWAERWNSYLLVDYAGAVQYWYGLGNAKYQLTNTDWHGRTSWFAGVDLVREGNDESDAYQAGGFLEEAFVKSNLSLGLHAGYQNTGSPGESRRTGGYLGVSFYQRF
jgi:hypothetical protein